MPEGLSADGVGKEIAEHAQHAAGEHTGRDRVISIRIAQQTQARTLDAQADADSKRGQSDAGTADKYVRLTVFLAAVLFLIAISSHFPIRAARYGLLASASALLLVSVVQLLGLSGPPA